jgi:hypothetical protein
MTRDRTSYPRCVLLGDDLLPLLVLAFGAAMAIGSGLALVRPPASPENRDLERPPLARSMVMIAIGVVAALWAVASLLAG